MTTNPPQGTVQIALRIRPDLRERIKAHAEFNGRSVNAELTATLEKHYPSEDEVKAVMRRAAASLQELGYTEEEAFKAIAGELVKGGVGGLPEGEAKEAGEKMMDEVITSSIARDRAKGDL